MGVNQPLAADATLGSVGFRPLYRQVKDILVDRIARGTWRGGEAIPSEFEIAAELATSQGTVRKALDEMAAENLVVRRQGRGTFVARHDDARIMFQFFKLVPDAGAAAFPESRVLSIGIGPAGEEAGRQLGLSPDSQVVKLVRERSLGGRTAILEDVTLPADPFGPLCDGPVPNNLYELYATRFGVTIARARERLKAVPAAPAAARSLGVAVGAPLLLVDRIAARIDGRPAEWRVSLCRTDDLHYLSDLK
ncbi:GntR family transcriptional regulator [uncultured Enterovirga sp.]|uniref:GntR family transcriptional regulator n=1 Tax=uncultured Enterovirga sp. TaxID=2026352 RepID=UPI0035CAEB42